MLFQEGICYKWHIKGRSYEEEGVSCTQEDIVVSLLADLQQLQTQEANNLSKDIQPKVSLGCLLLELSKLFYSVVF